MHKLSLRKLGVVEAYKAGFRIKNNQAFSPAGRIIKPRISTSGYLIFDFRFPVSLFPRKKVIIPFHSLVAYEKFGEKFLDLSLVVRHLDGDSQNNAFANIELGTQSQNTLDIPMSDIRKRLLKKSWKNRKLTNEQIVQIKIDRKSGMTYLQLSAKYGLAKSTLSFLFNKSIYFHSPTIEDAERFIDQNS